MSPACAIVKIMDKFWAQLRGDKRPLRLLLPDVLIHQAKANSDKYAGRICDPVIQACTVVEGGLYQLNNETKSD